MPSMWAICAQPRQQREQQPKDTQQSTAASKLDTHNSRFCITTHRIISVTIHKHGTPALVQEVEALAYTRIHAYIHACIHTYVYTCMHAYMH